METQMVLLEMHQILTAMVLEQVELLVVMMVQQVG